MPPGGSSLGTQKSHNTDESLGDSSLPARRFLENFQKREFSYSLDRLLTPNHYIFNAIQQYKIKGTVLAPLTWIPCSKSVQSFESLILIGLRS